MTTRLLWPRVSRCLTAALSVLLLTVLLGVGRAGGTMDTSRHSSAAPPLSPRPARPSALRPAGTPPPLHTKGNRIVRPDGRPVRLRGVNIASLEWSDAGENMTRSLAVAIDKWGSNLVRIPLSQDRWFGRAPSQHDGGKEYRAIVDGLVTEASRRGTYILLDLHWSDAGAWGRSIGQHRMPDTGSLRFWQDVARRYANHPAVLFGLYNEPFDIDWKVWREGGVVEEEVSEGEGPEASRAKTTLRYRAVGHQQLVEAVRAAGATNNVVVVGGLGWAYDLSALTGGRALRGKNIVYDTHVYPGKDWRPDLSWERAFLAPSRTLPVLVGEWGDDVPWHHDPKLMDRVVRCLRDSEQLSWTAWDLHPSAGPCLIRDWSYEPTEFGKVVMRELQSGRR